MSENDSDSDGDRDAETGLLPLWQVAPDLARITYSHDATVTAIKNYYKFLESMYISSDDIVWPPESGWPGMDAIRELGKSEQVINLLRHIPYIRPSPSDGEVQVASGCEFEDWVSRARYIATLPYPLSPEQKDSLLCITQHMWHHIPAHVVGLVKTPTFQILLDTKLGIVYFIGAHASPGPVRKASTLTNHLFPVITAEPDEYAIQEEEEWRGGGGGHCAWEIPDFFRMLEFHFREIHYVPFRQRWGWEVVENFDREQLPEELLPAWDLNLLCPRIREVFREYGWPDLERYRKEECIKAVESLVEEHTERN